MGRVPLAVSVFPSISSKRVYSYLLEILYSWVILLLSHCLEGSNFRIICACTFRYIWIVKSFFLFSILRILSHLPDTIIFTISSIYIQRSHLPFPAILFPSSRDLWQAHFIFKGPYTSQLLLLPTHPQFKLWQATLSPPNFKQSDRGFCLLMSSFLVI